MTRLAFFVCALLPVVGFTQNNVLTQVWAEANGVHSGTFGIPTVTDGSDNFYRAGFEKQSLGGMDVVLQKIDPEGELEWTVTLNTSGADLYQPSKLATNGTSVFVTGIVTHVSNGTSDFFISEVDASGNVQWFTTDAATGNDVAADLIYDLNTDNLFLCGSTQRNSTYDLLVAAYRASDGGQEWLQIKDYNGNADVGAIIEIQGGQLTVNGSSQSTSTSWDICSWLYQDDGTYQSETRSTGMNASSDQLTDGAVNSGYIQLAGNTDAGSHLDFKVVCLDANNNMLWSDTYNKNNQDDEGLAVVASSGTFAVAGYVTSSANKEDLLIRKYDVSTGQVWSREFDFLGEDDRALDIIEDASGNYLVLADVSDGVQTDVYLYYLDGATGDLEWSERVSDDAGLDENGISIESTLDGDVYVTYAVNNLSVTEYFSYGEMNFPQDDEPFSKGSFYISNSGQLKDQNEQSVMDVRYYSFGQSPSAYFRDQGISNLIHNSVNGSAQRVDFDFVNNNSTHVGQLEEYEKGTYFNYYGAQSTKYEFQSTFDILAYPGVYENIDAYISTNSEGFKMVLVLEEGANLNDFELFIDGSSGYSLTGGT